MKTGDALEMISLPVTCPICGTRSMTDFAVLVVATALNSWHPMWLFADCHPGSSWRASAPEILKLREFVGHAWLIDHDPGTTGIAKGATLPDLKVGRLPPMA